MSAQEPNSAPLTGQPEDVGTCEHDWEVIASVFTGYGNWNVKTGRVETVRVEKTGTRQVCILCGATKEAQP